MGLSLSRLERTPDKREVGGSSPLRPTENAKFQFFAYPMTTKVYRTVKKIKILSLSVQRTNCELDKQRKGKGSFQKSQELNFALDKAS